MTAVDDTRRCLIREIGASREWKPIAANSPEFERIVTQAQLLPFFRESQLEELIAESPSILPGIAGEPYSVARQVHIPHAGNADVVVVDQSGTITLIECKLVANSEVRNSVVGQTLSYGAGLWNLDFEAFESAIVKAGGSASFAALKNRSPDQVEITVARQLSAGSSQLVIAVDEITNELNSSICFLRERGVEIQLLGVELRRDRENAVDLLLLEEASEHRPRTKPERPTRDRLLTGLRALDPRAVHPAEDLLNWARVQDLRTNFTASEAVVQHAAGDTLFRVAGNGAKVRVSLRGIRSHCPPGTEVALRRFEEELGALGMVMTHSYAKLPLVSLSAEDARERFKALMLQALKLVVVRG